MAELIFLKLGGSLITDKDQPRTSRQNVLARLAQEIASARAAHPNLALIIGHGSGSFGHAAARKHGTRKGVTGAQGWTGFAEVWKEARTLNHLVLDALLETGLPIIAFPPSAAVIARQGKILQWDLAPIRSALAAGLMPLINGDTVFDQTLGGTIVSTEDCFFYLARQLHPSRILLAGIEKGVWADFPACTKLLDRITPASFPDVSTGIRGSTSVDVTGGMLEKVKSMLDLLPDEPGLKSLIFSGLNPGTITQVLLGASPGTMICRD